MSIHPVLLFFFPEPRCRLVNVECQSGGWRHEIWRFHAETLNLQLQILQRATRRNGIQRHHAAHSKLGGRFRLPGGTLQACIRPGQQKGRAHRSVAALSDCSTWHQASWAGTIILQP